MQHRDFQSNYKENFLDWWNNITLVRKPIVAAVNGYAFGGGCEVNLDLFSPEKGNVFGEKIFYKSQPAPAVFLLLLPWHC